MKRFNKIFLYFVIILFITGGSLSAFNTNTSVNLTVAIYNSDYLSITNIGDAVLSFGSVKAGTTNYFGSSSFRSIVKNNGTTLMTIKMRAAVTGGLALQNGSIGDALVNDQIRLHGVFCAWESNVSYTYFDDGTSDAIISTYQTCTATKFCDSDIPVALAGIDVSSTSSPDRNLKFAFETGTVTSEGVQQTITVYMTAIAP